MFYLVKFDFRTNFSIINLFQRIEGCALNQGWALNRGGAYLIILCLGWTLI